MNLLSVVLNRQSLQNDLIAEDNDFSYRAVLFHSERINIGARPVKNYVFNRERGVLCGAIGYISNISDLRKKLARGPEADDVDLIAELYLREGESSFPLLEGLFTVFICDFAKEKGYIFQDENGSYIPLLYVKTQEKIFFCNSLKFLLKNGAFPVKLNQQAARDFLCKRVVIPNGSTLVEGVSKLLPGQLITVDLQAGSMKIQAIRRTDAAAQADNARQNLIASIAEEVDKLSTLVKKPEIASALSSGFDSNLMLFFLNKQIFKKIICVTIGGKKVNEIPAASRCAAAYEKVRHVTAVVADTRLQDFPDVVWRTEGCVFEGGLFLTNEFGKALNREEMPVVFLGDGADQQLNPFRLKKGAFKLFVGRFKNRLKQNIVPLRKIWRRLKHKKVHVTRYPRAVARLKEPKQEFAYDVKKDYILKKSGVLFNSYGIQPLYPFLGRKTSSLAKSLSPKECHRKKFYKTAVREFLGPDISRNLKKIGGTVDIEYLCQDKPELFNKLLHDDLITGILPGLDDRQIRQILAQIPDYTEFLAHLLYIYLFNELFVSGKYDKLFDNEGLNISLKNFL